VEKYGRSKKARDDNIIQDKKDVVCLPDNSGITTDTNSLSTMVTVNCLPKFVEQAVYCNLC